MVVAEILAPHGIRGELRVLVLSDDPSRLVRIRRGRARDPRGGETRPLEVQAARPGPRGTWIVRVAGVQDRTAAEALRGALIEVPVEEAIPLPEGSYYPFEIEGMTVVDETGAVLGTIGDVLPGAGHDLWEVKLPTGTHGPGASFLVPAVRAIVKEVDRKGRRVVLSPPEGLVPGPAGSPASRAGQEEANET